MAATIPQLTPEMARELHRQAEEEQAFFLDHQQDFLEKYFKQFVVVHDRKVIAHSPDLNKVCRMVEKKGLDIQDVWLEYIADPDEPLIL